MVLTLGGLRSYQFSTVEIYLGNISCKCKKCCGIFFIWAQTTKTVTYKWIPLECLLT